MQLVNAGRGFGTLDAGRGFGTLVLCGYLMVLNVGEDSWIPPSFSQISKGAPRGMLFSLCDSYFVMWQWYFPYLFVVWPDITMACTATRYDDLSWRDMRDLLSKTNISHVKQVLLEGTPSFFSVGWGAFMGLLSQWQLVHEWSGWFGDNGRTYKPMGKHIAPIRLAYQCSWAPYRVAYPSGTSVRCQHGANSQFFRVFSRFPPMH